jgi:hypothetical protein
VSNNKALFVAVGCERGGCADGIQRGSLQKRRDA